MQWLDWMLFIPTLMGDWAYGNKWRWAPLTLCVLQVGWFAWGWVLSTPIAIMSSVFFVVHLRNHFKWEKERKQNETLDNGRGKTAEKAI